MRKQLTSFLVLLMILYLGNSLERKTYLKCGQQLWVNEYLQSTNGYYAVVQSDCNFVIYASKHFVSRNSLWSSKTARTNCVNPRLRNLRNGNLALYSGNTIIWSTGTNRPGNNCYQLRMQDDGNLVLYNANDVAVWNAGTNA